MAVAYTYRYSRWPADSLVSESPLYVGEMSIFVMMMDGSKNAENEAAVRYETFAPKAVVWSTCSVWWCTLNIISNAELNKLSWIPYALWDFWRIFTENSRVSAADITFFAV